MISILDLFGDIELENLGSDRFKLVVFMVKIITLGYTLYVAVSHVFKGKMTYETNIMVKILTTVANLALTVYLVYEMKQTYKN